MTRNCFIVGLTGIVLQWGFAQSVLAASPQGIYVGASAGYVWVEDATYDLVGSVVVPHPADFDGGPAWSLQGGYDFGGPRLELELTHRNNDVDGFGREGGPGKGDISADSAMVNLLYDFDVNPRYTPYVGVGLGWTSVEANGIRKDIVVPNRTGLVDGDDTVFSYQLIAGITYQTSRQLGVTLAYSYLNAGEPEFDYGVSCTPAGTACVYSSTLKEDYTAQTLSLGLRWKF